LLLSKRYPSHSRKSWSHTIILDKPEDWPMWIDEIRGSTPNSIWPLIDPDLTDNEEFIQLP
jgi:hypothetical protein